MTTPNDRWAEKAREILTTHIKSILPDDCMLANEAITQALRSAEKKGVRRGMEMAAVISENYHAPICVTSIDGIKIASIIREEANKEL